MTVGSLVVSLEANIAQFTSSMDKAAAISEQRMQQIDKSLGIVKTSLIALGSGALAGLTLDAVRDKIEGVIKAAAGLQELAERTGGTVEKLSGLAAVAKLSGTDMDSLATGMQKLSKSMIDAKDGGAKSIEAFRSIGISVATLKGMKPDEVFQLISQKMAGYANGAEKTAVAQQLLGKAGANLLPVMKDLADVSDLQVKVTAEQAAMALEYEHNLTRLSAASNAVWKTIAMEMLPAMNAFAQALVTASKESIGVKGAVDSLAKDGSIREWAENAVMALAAVIDTFRAMGSIAVIAGKTVGAAFAQGNAILHGDLQAAVTIGKEWQSDVAAILKGGESFSSRVQKQLDLARSAKPATAGRRPDPNYHPNSAANGLKDDPAKAYMEGVIKANDALIAAESKQLSTREQYLKEFYQEQYLSADEYYKTEEGLIQDATKAKLEAYDRDKQAALDYIAHLQKIPNTEKLQQEAANTLHGIEAKRLAAEIDGNEKLTQVMLESVKAYREFDLATTAAVYQWSLQNDAAKFSIDMLGRNTLEVQKLTEARKIDLELQQRIHALQLQGYSLDSPEIARARADAERQKATAMGLVEQAYRKQTDASFGASEALRKYGEDTANVGAQIESTMTNALKGVEDAFVSLATTGKINFKSLADSITADITRIFVKQQITGPLADWLKGGMAGGGGIGGMLSAVFGRSGSTATASDAAGAAQEAFRTSELIAQKAAETTATVTATSAVTALAEAATTAATALSTMGASGGASSGSGLLGMFGGGAAADGFGTDAASGSVDFAGYMAGGGDLAPGQWAVVGENGPEVFKPSGSGSIIPNDKLGGLGGGNTHVTEHHYHVTVQATPGMSRSTANQIGAEAVRGGMEAARRNGKRI